MSQTEVQEQWAQVEKSYPKVARAYKLIYKELIRMAFSGGHEFSEQFQEAVRAEQTPVLDGEMVARVAIDTQACLRQLKWDLTNSKEYDPGIMERFSSCWQSIGHS